MPVRERLLLHLRTEVFTAVTWTLNIFSTACLISGLVAQHDTRKVTLPSWLSVVDFSVTSVDLMIVAARSSETGFFSWYFVVRLLMPNAPQVLSQHPASGRADRISEYPSRSRRSSAESRCAECCGPT